MNSRIILSELSPSAVADFIAEEKIRKFSPARCTQCNQSGPFKRRIFRIEGKHRMDQDKTQDMLRRHIWNEFRVEGVFFRTHQKVHYADGAICGNCGSMKVMYDMEFDNGMFENLSKMLGIPKEKVQADLFEINEKLKKEDL
jgi:ribosomal protein S26